MNQKNNIRALSRRGFLKTYSVMAGAFFFGGSALFPGKVLAGIKDEISGLIYRRQRPLPEFRFGEWEEGKRRMLVAYASKYESTAEVSKAIGEELHTSGAAVDVIPIVRIKSLDGYDGVIVGSPIYYERWREEAIEFVQRHREALQSRPVAYFMLCMTMRIPSEENKAQARGYINEVVKGIPEITPVDIGLFAGYIDRRKTVWLLRNYLRTRKLHTGDYRDWNAIRTWGSALYAKLALK